MSNGKFRPASIPRSIEAFTEKKVLSSEELECEKRGYKLSRTTLGRGAYAKVKLAYATNEKLEKDKALMMKLKDTKDNKVAIKIISKKSAPVEYLNKFMPREIETLNTTYGYPNVIKLYETFRSENRIYLVMEYANKGDLLEFINSGAYKLPGIGEARAKKFFWQLIMGIEHCHRKNVVHRDLKCENILIHDDDIIKISDFGFATRFPTTRVPFLETFCGSYAYAAPEILQAEKYDGKIADIWSLGVVLFAMLNGKLPFNDRDVSTLVAQTRGSLKFSTRVHLSPVKGHLGLETCIKKKPHSDCQDLVRRILTANLQKRITIPDILRHPWMMQLAQQEDSQSRGIPDGKSEKSIFSHPDKATIHEMDLSYNDTAFKRMSTNDGAHQNPSLDKTKWIETNSNQSTMTKLLRKLSATQLTAELTMNEQPRSDKENDTKNRTTETSKEVHSQANPPCTATTTANRLANRTVSSNGRKYPGFRYQNDRPDSRECKFETRRRSSQRENRWNEVKIPVSNMKTSGFNKLYYPGFKNSEKASAGFSLPPVSSHNRSSSSTSGKLDSKVGSESKHTRPPIKKPATSSVAGSRWATVTTEIINLRSNWQQGISKRKDSRNEKNNMLTYFTLSGKEVENGKPSLNKKTATKLNIFGRAPRYKVD